MRKMILPIVVVLLFLFIFLSESVLGGHAGVGVLNVSPEYRATRIIQTEDVVKIYLTVSDYNSWRDVYQVDLFLENHGVTIAQFRFRQYESTISYEEVDEFREIQGNGYLLPDECSVSRSSSKETVDDRCLLHVVFVFTPIPYCTRIAIFTYDRGGLFAEASIGYPVEGFARNQKVIVPFWTGSPVEVSPDLLNVVAVSVAFTATAVVVVKRREKYE